VRDPWDSLERSVFSYVFHNFASLFVRERVGYIHRRRSLLTEDAEYGAECEKDIHRVYS